MNKLFLRITLLAASILIFSAAGFADEGEAIFKKVCAACHTIGMGRLVGPDLKGITGTKKTEWLHSFIKSSTTMIKSGDPEAQAIFKEYNNILMPDNHFTDTQITAVLNYIGTVSKGAGNQAATATEVAPPEIVLGELTEGEYLFAGRSHLAGGGPACISCHKVRDERIFSSGLLAKDLSLSFENMGAAGVMAIIQNPPFPIMNQAYKNHPVTQEEVAHLTAYLKSVSEERFYQRPTDFSPAFAVFGIMVFFGIIMTTIILYVKRKKRAVNQEILDRPSIVVN